MERLNGADGRISLKWKTDDMTAKAGQDYEAGDSELVFEQGETTKTIEIAIYDDQVRASSGNIIIQALLSVLFL